MNSITEQYRIEIFDCECHSWDHAMRFQFDPTEDDVRCLEVWVDAAFPANRSLWQRIVLAYKYITRTGSSDWTYGSWILQHKDYKRLRNFFTAYDMAVWKLEQKIKGEQKADGDKQKDSVQ